MKAVAGRLVRFGIVGVALTLLNYAVYLLALRIGMHYLIAAMLGWSAGIVFSYFANKWFTFAQGHSFVWREFLALATGYVLQLALGLIGLALLIEWLGFGEKIAFWLNLPITAGFSFLYMQIAVFRNKPSSNLKRGG